MPPPARMSERRGVTLASTAARLGTCATSGRHQLVAGDPQHADTGGQLDGNEHEECPVRYAVHKDGEYTRAGAAEYTDQKHAIESEHAKNIVATHEAVHAEGKFDALEETILVEDGRAQHVFKPGKLEVVQPRQFPFGAEHTGGSDADQRRGVNPEQCVSQLGHRLSLRGGKPAPIP